MSFIRAVVLVFSMAAVMLGVLLIFCATKFLPRSDSADVVVGFSVSGLVFILLGIWHACDGFRKYRKTRR